MTLSTVCVTVTRTQCVAGMNEIRGSVCVCVFYYITRLLFLHPGHAQCACTSLTVRPLEPERPHGGPLRVSSGCCDALSVHHPADLLVAHRVAISVCVL